MQIQAVCCFMLIRTKSAITYQYRHIARPTLPFMYSWRILKTLRLRSRSYTRSQYNGLHSADTRCIVGRLRNQARFFHWFNAIISQSYNTQVLRWSNWSITT
jgi:hypothetical protein